MDALLTVLFVFACIALFFRLFGKYLIAFALKRLARRFGMQGNAPGNAKKRQSSPPPPAEKPQVIPDDVGEYVDFEETKG